MKTKIALLFFTFVTCMNFAQANCINPTENIDSYPLIKSLLEGRSRRFFKGVELPGGPLKFKSSRAPEKLTHEEEALLAFAGAGITGYVAADLPYQAGPKGNGNTMMQVVGRSFASPDAAALMSLVVINDDGAWLIRRPQDLSASETEHVILLGKQHKWVDAYRFLRIKIADTRVAIPTTPNITPTFNIWSVNKPGTTYFLPLIDYTTMYLSGLFAYLDPTASFNLVDERAGYKSAGLDKFVKSRGGWLEDDLLKQRTFPVSALETVVGELAAVEVGGALQNMRLMAQALGLGGFPHFAGTPGTWGKVLNFDMVPVASAKLAGYGPVLALAAKLLGKSYDFPAEVGVSRGGHRILTTYTPAIYGSAEATVKAFVLSKFGVNGKLRDNGDLTAWKNAAEIKRQIPSYSAAVTDAIISHVNYVYEKYGRFPAGLGSLGYVTAFQAHVLDPDFYNTFYREGILSDTHRCRSGK